MDRDHSFVHNSMKEILRISRIHGFGFYMHTYSDKYEGDWGITGGIST